MGTGVEFPLAEELIGSEIGGSFLGDTFAGDALGSVITDAGVGGSFLGDTTGASMFGNIGGASSLLGNIGGYGIGNLINPSTLGAYNGLEATSGLGIGNISNAAGIPIGSLNNIIAPEGIASKGIFSLPTGAPITGLQGVGPLAGDALYTDYASLPMTQSQVAATNAFNTNVPSLVTPTQQQLAGDAMYTSYKDIPMTQSEIAATNAFNTNVPTQQLAGDAVYTSYKDVPMTTSQSIAAGAGRTPGFVENLNMALNPFDSAGASQRLEALGNVGSKAFEKIFMNKGELNLPAVFAALSLYPTFAAAKAKAGQLGVPFSESDYQANKIASKREGYAAMTPKSAFGIKAANGGRIGLESGGMSNNRISQLIQLLRDAESKGDKDTVDQIMLDLYRETRKAKGGRIGYEGGKLVTPKEGPGDKRIRLEMEAAAKKAQEEFSKRKAEEQLMDENYKKWSMYDWKKGQKELFDMAPEQGYTYPEPVQPAPMTPNQQDGILSIKLTPAQGKKKGGMMDHPVRMLEGGISELDLRAKGGYIPYGVKEKADDVPAMLSKNEFVFTADAVKGAGGGNVNKGAVKMYKLMKSLEKKTKKEKVA